MKSECLETEIILCKRQSHRKVFRSQISLCCPSKIDEKCHRHEHTRKLLSAVKVSPCLWFKQYFISMYTYKYLTMYMINGPGSDSKLKACTSHFLLGSQ